MTRKTEYITMSHDQDGYIRMLPQKRHEPSRIALQIIILTLSLIMMLGIGYVLGVRNANTITDSFISTSQDRMQVIEVAKTLTAPPGDQHYYMHFNATFPQRSSDESDSAWDSLFPKKLGFVQHPDLAPHVAGIAVFHELHCLVRILSDITSLETDKSKNILRQAFWASVDGKLKEMSSEDRDKNHRASHHHIRHCFEYLRQSLICLADSNLENMNYTARGVSGWQTERTCRSFDRLTDWANVWGVSREEALSNFDLQASLGGKNFM